MKYKIYKYSRNWYGACPHCAHSFGAAAWWQVRDMLILHSEKHVLTLVSSAR